MVGAIGAAIPTGGLCRRELAPLPCSTAAKKSRKIWAWQVAGVSVWGGTQERAMGVVQVGAVVGALLDRSEELRAARARHGRWLGGVFLEPAENPAENVLYRDAAKAARI